MSVWDSSLPRVSIISLILPVCRTPSQRFAKLSLHAHTSQIPVFGTETPSVVASKVSRLHVHYIAFPTLLYHRIKSYIGYKFLLCIESIYISYFRYYCCLCNLSYAWYSRYWILGYIERILFICSSIFSICSLISFIWITMDERIGASESYGSVVAIECFSS